MSTIPNPGRRGVRGPGGTGRGVVRTRPAGSPGSSPTPVQIASRPTISGIMIEQQTPTPLARPRVTGFRIEQQTPAGVPVPRVTGFRIEQQTPAGAPVPRVTGFRIEQPSPRRR